MGNAGELPFTGTLASWLSIVRLDVGLLIRLARLDQAKGNAVAGRPNPHRFAGELSAVVRAPSSSSHRHEVQRHLGTCLLYTSDAADE